MPDVFGGLGDLLGGGLKDLAGGVFNELSQWLWSAGLDILKVGVGLADKFGTVNLDVHSGPMAAVWSVTLPIGLAIAGCTFYFALATVPLRGRGGLLRAVSGIGQFGVTLAGSAAAFASLVAVSDAFTTFILVKGLSSSNFEQAFSHTGFSDTTANAVKGGALALMSLFGVIPIGVGFAFENVMRAATIYLLLAVIPITAAGLLSGNTSSWYWKTSHWMMAAIAMKPVMALALALGVGIAGGGQGLAALIVGLAVLFVALFAPLALFRLFAFSSEKATDAVKGGWNTSGGADALSGATDKVTSMASGSQSTSSMEFSTDARYGDAATSTDKAAGSGHGAGTGASAAGATEMANIAYGTPATGANEDSQAKDINRPQHTNSGRAKSTDDADGTVEAPAPKHSEVEASAAPAGAPGQPSAVPQQTPDTTTKVRQPPADGAGQQETPAPVQAGGGDHGPTSGNGAGDVPGTSGSSSNEAPAPTPAPHLPGGGATPSLPDGAGGAVSGEGAGATAAAAAV